MRQKKLLTAACFLGILACGACFLPEPHAPPPPLPPALAAVHKLAIQVKDATGEKQPDTTQISDATVRQFNRLWSDYPIRAVPFHDAKSAEALLTILILRETASCSAGRNGAQFCMFDLQVSFSVTGNDGRVLLSKPSGDAQFGHRVNGRVPPAAWNTDEYRLGAASTLAMKAGLKILD